MQLRFWKPTAPSCC